MIISLSSLYIMLTITEVCNSNLVTSSVFTMLHFIPVPTLWLICSQVVMEHYGENTVPSPGHRTCYGCIILYLPCMAHHQSHRINHLPTITILYRIKLITKLDILIVLTELFDDHFCCSVISSTPSNSQNHCDWFTELE